MLESKEVVFVNSGKREGAGCLKEFQDMDVESR